MTLVVSITDTYAQVGVEDATYQVAVLQYRGGGDWYSNPTSLPNLIRFCNTELSMNIDEEMVYVEVNSPDLSLYPFVHMTGHGNVVFSSSEARNLRNYLLAGGFLHISDNYGMDAFVRKEFLKVFPKLDWVEVPFSHPVYHQTFDFDQGLPKVHEHDDLPPRGLGIFFEGRLLCFYDTECDLGDGWEDYQVHRDPESVRLLALQMGANLMQFAMGGAE
ncbi:MAG: hypothetical protein CL831_03050 [Crocinitomicaceae bacterium]|nr:hypothetical protein [Crocinitomicaceae bacterium]